MADQTTETVKQQAITKRKNPLRAEQEKILV